MFEERVASAEDEIQGRGTLPWVEVAFTPEVVEFAKGISDLPRNPFLSVLPRALVVGTAPLGGRHSSDVDFEIYGVDPESLRRYVEQKCDDGRLTLQSFGGNAYLFAIVFDATGTKYDISLPVTEHGAVERYGTTGVVADPELTFEIAAKRRDFTFTAIGADPLTGEVLDPFGGRSDFERKILRAVSPETAGRDPLMTLRALRFVALYDFTVDPVTAGALSNALKQPATLSSMNAKRDRLQYEFTRLFAAEGLPSKALQFGAQIEIFDCLFPKIAAMQKHKELWAQLLASSDGIAKQYEHADKESPERKAAQLANFTRHFINSDSENAARARDFLAEICHSQEDVTQTLISLELG